MQFVLNIYDDGCKLKLVTFSMLSQAQPFNMNAMGRSGFPAAEFEPIGMGRSRFSPAGMVTPGFNPSQMAFSRQLSSITGISVPISAQPGMGIVGEFALIVNNEHNLSVKSSSAAAQIWHTIFSNHNYYKILASDWYCARLFVA